MQWKGIKIPIVILALLVGLTALWGGQRLFNSYSYEHPLTGLLEENRDVISYQINDSGPVLDIQVRLKKVDNLQEVYNRLYQTAKSTVGDRKTVKITVQDNRDQLLESLYSDARLAAYESLERGNFLEMSGYIERLAAGEGAQARVFLDGDQLFIQIQHKDKYLYDIIPRPGQGGVLTGDGGEGGRLT